MISLSVSRPSKVIEKLNEKRRRAHEDAIRTLREAQLQLNLEADAEIERESATFTRKLRDLKDEVDFFIRGTQFQYREMYPHIFMGENIVSKQFQKVSSFFETLEANVDAFYGVLLGIEKRRSEGFKSILNETSNRVSSAAHVLPLEAEEFFCGEILELNKITLNNYQNFAELKKELKLQVSRYMKVWTEELLEIKERQKHYIMELSRKSMQRLRSVLKSDIAMISQSDGIMDAMKILETLQSDLQWLNDSQAGIPVCRQEVELWLEDVQKKLASLDLSARNLVSLYKAIIIVLFNRFFSELAELKKSMTTNGLVAKEEIEDYQSEIYTPTFEELNVQFENEFEILQNIWEEKMDTMELSMQTTYKFLKGSASLWDRHFKRVIDLQGCVLMDLQNTVELNSQSSMVFEAELSIKIEKLRQGADEKKLDCFLADVQGTLDKIENLYRIYSDKENQVVQKYKTMMEIEIDVLMAEIHRFLTLNPPDADRDPKIQRKRASQCSEKEIDPRELLVPNQIIYCVFQVDATKNWMFGLWEAIKNYTSTGRAEILAITEQWMGKQREKINDRLQVKLAFHSPRYFRIKCSIFDKRLRELKIHSERFASHKMAAEHEVISLKNYDRSIAEEFSKIFTQFVSRTKDLLQKANKFNKSYQLRGILQTLGPLLKSHKESLAKEQNDFLEQCTGLLDKIRVSGYLYLKSTRLFSEEGSFSIEEIKFLQKHIPKLDEHVKKTLNKYTNDVQTKFTKYSGFLDNTYTNTLSTFEELIREMEHNEKVVELIEKLRKDIKKEVIRVKTTMKKIETDAKNLIQKFSKDVSSIEHLVSFVGNYQEITERMQDFVRFMGQPSHRVAVSAATSISGHFSRIGHHRSHIDHDDFSFISQLNRVHNTFLSKLNELLNESYLEISRRSKEFYAKHHILLLDNSRIQPSYERCMDEVRRKYNNFHAQCEACWHENVKEFLDFSIDFQNLKNNYSKEVHRNARENSIRRCKDTGRTVMNELEDHRKKIDVDFRNIFKRLRTLYGHPNNKVLLEDLQKEFDDFENKYANVKDIPTTHEEVLLNVYKKEVEYFEQVQGKLSILKDDDTLLNIIEDLKRRLTDEPIQSCQLLESESENNTLQSDSKILAKNTTSAKDRPSDSSPSASSASTEGNTAEFLEELERTYQADVRDAEDFVKTRLIEHVEGCKRIWMNEVDFVRGLFEVKYDDKNAF